MTGEKQLKLFLKSASSNSDFEEALVLFSHPPSTPPRQGSTNSNNSKVLISLSLSLIVSIWNEIIIILPFRKVRATKKANKVKKNCGKFPTPKFPRAPLLKINFFFLLFARFVNFCVQQKITFPIEKFSTPCTYRKSSRREKSSGRNGTWAAVTRVSNVLLFCCRQYKFV